jgi:hypothetical protein
VRTDGEGEVPRMLRAFGVVVGVEIVGMGLLFGILFGVERLEMSSSGAGRFRDGEDGPMMSPTDMLKAIE